MSLILSSMILNDKENYRPASIQPLVTGFRKNLNPYHCLLTMLEK